MAHHTPQIQMKLSDIYAYIMFTANYAHMKVLNFGTSMLLLATLVQTTHHDSQKFKVLLLNKRQFFYCPFFVKF